MLTGKVVRILEQDRLALSLGGDHSVGLGTVAGSLDHCQAGKPGLFEYFSRALVVNLRVNKIGGVLSLVFHATF